MSNPVYKIRGLPWPEDKNPLHILSFDQKSALALQNRPDILPKVVSLLKRAKMLIFHPDHTGDEEMARDLNVAADRLDDPYWQSSVFTDFFATLDKALPRLEQARRTMEEQKIRLDHLQAEVMATRGARSAIPEPALNALERRLRAWASMSIPEYSQLSVRAVGTVAAVYPRHPVRREDVPIAEFRYVGSADVWAPILPARAPEEALVTLVLANDDREARDA